MLCFIFIQSRCQIVWIISPKRIHQRFWKTFFLEGNQEFITTMISATWVVPSVEKRFPGRMANKGKKKEKLFNHTWLCKADIAYCAARGYWWPVSVEDEEVNCILCKKHNVHFTRNKREILFRALSKVQVLSIVRASQQSITQ